MSSTARNPGTNSKWSINIQEIVKRTQRNLDKGSSSLTRTYNEDKSQQSFPRKLDAGTNEAAASTQNLYRDLKKKLALEGLGTESEPKNSVSAKNAARPQSAAHLTH